MERPEKPDLEQYGISEADIKAYRDLLELEESKKKLEGNTHRSPLTDTDGGRLSTYGCFVPFMAVTILIWGAFLLVPLGAFFKMLEEGNFFRDIWFSFLGFLFTKNVYGWNFVCVPIAVSALIAICYDIKGFVVNRKEVKEINLKIDQIFLSLELRNSCVEWIHIFEEYESELKDYNRHRDKKRAEKRRQEEGFWLKLDGHNFESEFARLLRKNGYKARVTRGSGDDGIDIIASNHLGPLVVQCKAWKARVPPKEIRDFVGAWSMHNNKIGNAWFIGLGGFTKSAIETAGKSGVKIMAIKHVIDLACQVEDSDISPKD